jgi:hypothetical protein
MNYKHMDEAWPEATRVLRAWLRQHEVVARAVLAVDVFGRIRVVLWGAAQDLEPLRTDLAQKMSDVATGWWSGDLWLAGTGDGDPVHALAWNEGAPDSELPERMRLLERHRNRGAWFTDLQEPVWQSHGADEAEGPPVIVFYSFKGGLGRSTVLASFAIQRARLGERVAVLDFDLDAPGVGLLLAADAEGRTAQWGTVDYLLERDTPGPLSDYYHPCRRLEVVGDKNGEILVFPAGRLDAAYPGKLARVDLEPSRNAEGFDPVVSLLRSIHDELDPAWILLDVRTGLSEPAGALLSGLAHLHVLFGTPSEQSWQGLRVVIERLGARRVAQDLPQGDCVLVQAMVPADTETAKGARVSFETHARDEFSDTEHGYYAVESDELWDLRDLETEDAPHVPVPLSYDLRLAHFRDVADVANLLAESPEYLQLAERMAARFKDVTDE